MPGSLVYKPGVTQRTWDLQEMAREIIRLRNLYRADPRRIDYIIEAESVATERYALMRNNR